MAAKKLLTLIIMLGAAYSVLAQDTRYQKIHPFDHEKFEERLREFNQLQLDTINLPMDSITAKKNEQYSMRILEIPENKIALMPTLPLGKDMQYTMPIKRYHNYYIPKSLIPKQDSLFRNDDLLHLHIPKNKQ